MIESLSSYLDQMCADSDFTFDFLCSDNVLSRPDMISAVDLALQTSYLSIYL